MRLGTNLRQARRFVLAGAVLGMVLFGSGQSAQATVNTVTFSGASQVAAATTDWTVGFTTNATGNTNLAAGGTVTAVFDSAFTIPATPTIALLTGFVSCTATGSTTGTTVTITLAGASCALGKGVAATFSIAGITNPVAGTYLAAGFTVATSKETTAVADGANEVITATVPGAPTSVAGTAGNAQVSLTDGTGE